MDKFTRFAIESWAWYSVGIVVIFLRLAGQISRYGIKNIQIDDYVMTIVIIFYTTFAVMNYFTAQAFDTGENSTAGITDLASDNALAYINGSKYILVAEQGMINTLYTLKICMLLLYYRLTLGRRFSIVVKMLGGYVVIAWIGNQLGFFLLTCRPFSGNWATPPPNPQCVSWQHYSLTQGVLNISTDFIILFFPIPLFLQTSYPIKQKIYLYIVFSMGIFVITCAIINKLHINDDDWMFWNAREAGTAVCVSNIPILMSLLRLVFSKASETAGTTSTVTKTSWGHVCNPEHN